MVEELSRRALFSGLRDSVHRRALERVARRQRPIRPPGAIDEVDFLQKCDGCLDCVDACPYGSIFVLHTEDVADGTPILSPAERPCHLCSGLPCAQACPTGALVPVHEPVDEFGWVTVSTAHCFTFRGPECGACGDFCPTSTQALNFVRNRPVIDPEGCVGCGLCIAACPASPVALKFHPSNSRSGETR